MLHNATIHKQPLCFYLSTNILEFIYAYLCVQVHPQVCHLATYNVCVVIHNCAHVCQVLNMCMHTFKFMLCNMDTLSVVMLRLRCCTGAEAFQVKISFQILCVIEEGYCRDSHIAILYFKYGCTHIS